jgi:Zn-finger nucleic acid-binding protein
MQNDSPPSPHDCPVCKQPMIPHEIKGVSLELCNEHGTWLPDEQLAEIVMRVQKEAKAQNSKARRRVRRLIRRRRAEREMNANKGGNLAFAVLFSGLFS